MIDPITALAAVSSAVNLVKKAVKTVQDVQSLGPVLGQYFDAKAQAIEVVEKAKTGGFKGSALGKVALSRPTLERLPKSDAGRGNPDTPQPLGGFAQSGHNPSLFPVSEGHAA